MYNENTELQAVHCTTSPVKTVSDVIFADYDSSLRPVCNGTTQVNATLGIALRQVIELKWNDCLLQWDPNDFDGITNIIVPYKKIWVPDLTLYDSISSEFFGLADFRPTIYYDGSVYYNFPTVIEALCPIDVANFPFDSQKCELIFGSWAYHGFSLDFSPRSSAVDLSSMKQNVEWEVPNLTVERHVVYYGCCPEPYPDVTFYFHLKRKPAFYVTNIIIPSIMITILVALGFILPVSSGEKVSLVITVMLAMSVFQLLVADKLPPSAEATPWIVIFFNFILGLSGVSTILQGVVINVFYRGEQAIPYWLMKGVITTACLITFVTLPGAERNNCCTKKVFI
ncbi:neuronal acetylcholine receptor subunit alpha-10-like [Mytilus californianus]|uniref:neuronal acetylcholine receptor subunit alpha-10-like n=1 Tax=Mytilus californianus TaxID=6549 RepID=UPI002246E498|nr:neuronal acetylcholine receptor subunit alpha-10-like [Mytilus californianus]